MLRAIAWFVICCICGAIGVGLAGAALTAFGWGLPIDGTHGIAAWRELLIQPGLQRALTVSFVSGLMTAAISLATVFLFIAGWHDTKLFAIMRRLLSPLLSLPHAAAAIGLAFLIAPSGLIARAILAPLLQWQEPPDILIVNDPWGFAMMAGLIVKEIPFLLLMSLAALPQIDAGNRMRVTRSLGYGPVCGWIKAVAPGLYPLLRLPVYAVIGYATSAVDVAMILGPRNPPILAVEVLRWMNDPDLSLMPMAAAGALLQLGLTLAALAVWFLGEQFVRLMGSFWATSGGRRCGDLALSLIAAIITAAAAAFTTFGLFALCLASFARSWRFPALLPQSWTVEIWQSALAGLAAPLLSTLSIGAVATALSLAAAVGVLENEFRRGATAGSRALMLLYAPLIIPQIVFLFSFVIAAEWADLAPTLALVVSGHLLFVFPYVYLSLAEPYRRLDRRWFMAAQSLGASANRIFWGIRLPMLLAPMLTAAAVGFAVSVGLYLPTLMLGAGRIATLTTEAVALGAGGDRRSVGVWAMLQTLLPAMAFAFALGVPRFLWRHRRAMRELG